MIPPVAIKALLIAIDQLFAVVLFGTMPDETLSARAHRTGGAWEPVIDALFFWQDAHCFEYYLSEKERKQLPQEYR